jgi:primase-polymerase (primpol)-like protein
MLAMPSAKRTRKTSPPRAGLGQQLGGLFDQMLAGHPPSHAQLEQVAADMVGKVIGRTVTVEEVQAVRRGDYAPLREVAEQYQRTRQEQAASRSPRPFINPDLAAKIERAKELGRARAVLKFTKNDILTVPIIKTRHRELARQHHPDAGGSTEKMQKVNWAADLLVQSLSPPSRAAPP